MGKVTKMQPAPADEKILTEATQAFFKLMRQSFAWFQAAAAEQGLSTFQAKLLLFLEPGKPCSMSEVAEMAACGPSHITGVIDKLEARKLVRRSAVKGDRRVKQVSITKAGANLRNKLSQSLSRPLPWMRELHPKDQRQLRDILQRGASFESQS